MWCRCPQCSEAEAPLPGLYKEVVWDRSHSQSWAEPGIVSNLAQLILLK